MVGHGVDDWPSVTVTCYWCGPLCSVPGKKTVDGENKQEQKVVCHFNFTTWSLMQWARLA